MIERIVEITYDGDGLYGHLFSMAKTLQREFPDRISDEQIVEIIDPAVEDYFRRAVETRGSWDDMDQWIGLTFGEDPDEMDLGGNADLLPLHIAYGAAGFGEDGEELGYLEMEELDPLLNRIYLRLEDLIKPQKLSMRSNGWRWKRGLDHYPELEGKTHTINPDGTVYGPLFQIEPDVFRGWEFVISGQETAFVINRRFK